MNRKKFRKQILSISAICVWCTSASVVNAIKGNDEGFTTVSSEKQADTLLSTSWSSGYNKQVEAVYIDDINRDGRLDLKIKFARSKIDPSRQITEVSKSPSIQFVSPYEDAPAALPLAESTQKLTLASAEAPRSASDLLESRLIPSERSKTNPGLPGPPPPPEFLIIQSTSATSYKATLDRIDCAIEYCQEFKTRVKAQTVQADFNGSGRFDILVIPGGLLGKSFPEIVVYAGGSRIIDSEVQHEAARVVFAIRDKINGKRLGDYKKLLARDFNADRQSELQLWLNPNNDQGAITLTTDLLGHFYPTNIDDLPNLEIPSSNPNCAQNIDVPGASTGYFLSGHCKTAYILPPAIGSTKVTGVNPKPALNMCADVREINKKQSEAQIKLASLQHQLVQIIEVELNSNEYQQLSAAQRIAEEALRTLADQKAIQERRVEDAREDFELIREDYEDGYADLDELEEAQEILDAEIAKLEGITFDFLIAVEVEKDAAQALLDYTTAIAQQKQNLENAILQMGLVINDYRNILKEMNALEGGSLVFDLNLEWDTLISEFAGMNRHLPQSTWQKIASYDRKLHTTLTNESAKFSGILWTQVHGLHDEKLIFTGENAQLPPIDDSIFTSLTGQQNATTSLNRYTGEMGMNLASMCQYFSSASDTDVTGDVQQIPQILGLNLDQAYQTSSPGAYRVAFNASKLAQEIYAKVKDEVGTITKAEAFQYYALKTFLVDPDKTLVTDKPFRFNKDELIKLINEIDENEWFKIVFLSNGFNLAEQETIRTDLKASIIDRMLATISIRYNRTLPGQEHPDFGTYVLISPERLSDFLDLNQDWQFQEKVGFHFTNHKAHTEFNTLGSKLKLVEK